MPRISHNGDGPAHEVRVLVATADRCLGAWASDRLRAAGMNVCDEVAGSDDAVLRAGQLGPDVCLLDVALPGGAIAALRRMHDAAPATRVMMLARSADDPALLPALRGGASGCMVGTPEGLALGRALADVLAGRTTLPRALVTRLVTALGPA